MSIVIAVIALCIIILIHELGHYGAAKLFGMNVYQFNLGMGPSLIKKKWKGTVWAIKAFPIGGSCMLGEDDIIENPEELNIIQDLKGCDPETMVNDPRFLPLSANAKRLLDPNEFRNKPVWQRIIVISGGAVLNLVLGWVLAVIICSLTPISSLTVGDFHVAQPLSDKGDSALMVDDRIVSVSGMKIISSNEILYIMDNTLMRGGDSDEHSTTVSIFGDNAISKTGEGALQSGDRIVSVGGVEVKSAIALYDELQRVAAEKTAQDAQITVTVHIDEKGNEVDENDEAAAGTRTHTYVETELEVWRVGVPLKVTLSNARIPVTIDEEGNATHLRDFFVQAAYEFVVIRDGEKVTLPQVTFAAAPNERGGISYVKDFRVWEAKKSFKTVMEYSLRESVGYGRIIWLTLGDIVRGTYGLNDLSGPVGIGGIVSEAATYTESFGELILTIVSISTFITINLGIVNLMPIPALDGGRIIFLAVEGVRRKPLNQNVEATIHFIGFALLMLLIVIVTFNDIRKLVTGG